MAVDWLALLDFTNTANLYQNRAGTTPVTTVGQRIGRVNDPVSGLAMSEVDGSGVRFTLRSDGARLYAESDGYQYLEDGNHGAWFDTKMNGRDPWWFCVAVRLETLSDAATLVTKQHGASPYSGAGIAFFSSGGQTRLRLRRQAAGFDLSATINDASIAQSQIVVVSGGYDGNNSTIRINLGTKVMRADANSLPNSSVYNSAWIGSGGDGTSKTRIYACGFLDSYPSPEDEESGIREVGQLAGLFASEVVEAVTGAAVAGASAAAITQTARVAAGSGRATVSGLTAGVERTAAVAASVGTARAAALPAAVVATVEIAAATARANAQGQSAQLEQTLSVSADVARATASGLQASVSETAKIVSQPAKAIARGLAAVVTATATIAASVGRAFARGMQAGIAIGGAIAAGVGQATASGRQAAIRLRETLVVSTGAAVARGLPAVLGGTITIAAATGTAVASGLPATVGTGGTIECGVGAAIARSPATTISQHQVIAATAAHARAAALPATIGEPTMGPYRATLSVSQRGASIAASTRGATVRRIT